MVFRKVRRRSSLDSGKTNRSEIINRCERRRCLLVRARARAQDTGAIMHGRRGRANGLLPRYKTVGVATQPQPQPQRPATEPVARPHAHTHRVQQPLRALLVFSRVVSCRADVRTSRTDTSRASPPPQPQPQPQPPPFSATENGCPSPRSLHVHRRSSRPTQDAIKTSVRRRFIIPIHVAAWESNPSFPKLACWLADCTLHLISFH